ncbi:MAG: hypothetical protein AAGD25_15080 [Cyanobacteria bacterium P01_F01_bin.150]
MDRGRTLIDDMADQHDIADCDVVVDGNGERQQSSDTPDQIGEPRRSPVSSPQPVPKKDDYEEVPF